MEIYSRKSGLIATKNADNMDGIVRMRSIQKIEVPKQSQKKHAHHKFKFKFKFKLNLKRRIKKIKFPKWLKIFLLIFFIVIVAGLLFLKLNITAAAYFTDNVLRPVFGDQRIVYVEKIFFNASDELQKLTVNQNNLKAPQFDDGDSSKNIAGGNLDLTPLAVNASFKPLDGEGVWKNWPLKLFPNKEIMAYTFFRSDPDRPYSMTTLVQMDMSQLKMGSVAGIQQPGGPVGKPGPGKIPQEVVASNNLVAAFDGGFQYKDGQYGMIVGDTTYLPLKNDLGTIVGYKDGSIKIIDYTGQDLGSNVEFVRQNCPLLISNGEVSVTDPRSRALWGRLVTGTVDIFTWRSGIGMTKNGNLIFAVGNNLTPNTLANALKAAGAVNAIQLDINPVWVRFNIFESAGPGKYDSTPLTKDLHDGSSAYLNGYDKDFFYLYKK